MRELITINDILNNDSLIESSRNFYSNIKRLSLFGMYCSVNTFISLFDFDEGVRLWNCFINDCDRDIFKFYTSYIDNKQAFIITCNIIEREEELRYCSIISSNVVEKLLLNERRK